MGFEITEIADSVWYAPDISGNRELETPFRVLIKPMSARQMRQIEERHGTLNRGKVNFTKRYNTIRAQIVESCVLEVEHLTVRRIKDGETVREQVTTGKQLAKVANEALLEDIIEALKDQSLLEEGIVGKSEPCSDISPSPATLSVPGVAVAVPTTSSQTIPATKTPPILKGA